MTEQISRRGEAGEAEEEEGGSREGSRTSLLCVVAKESLTMKKPHKYLLLSAFD